MSRTRTPRDMPAQDPIDRLNDSSERLRQVASDLYSADLNTEEITKKTEVHVHNHVLHPSQPDGRLSDLPDLPVKHSPVPGIVAGLAGFASVAAAVARALGWL